MEGTWRGRLLASALALCGALLSGGCGDGDSSAGKVRTADPAREFAPLVSLHPAERLMPADPLWTIARSALWFADDQGCEHQKISVGRALKAQRDRVIDWTFVTGLGHGPSYWREAALADCERDREAYRYYANQRTRPYDPGAGRAPGLRLGEGYYLDLIDTAREGQPIVEREDQLAVTVPAYFESRPAEVDGEPGLQLSYWLLFAMNAQLGSNGPVGAMTHEGDWERVEVLLRGNEGSYEPVSVRLPTPGGDWRERPWRSVDHVAGGPGGRRTHPVLLAARGSHTLYTRPGRVERSAVAGDGTTVRVVDVSARRCSGCPRWAIWEKLGEARRQAWYGFGGAWGEPGRSELTTGPLGPHGDDWPKGDPAEDYRRAQVNRRLRRGG